MTKLQLSLKQKLLPQLQQNLKLLQMSNKDLLEAIDSAADDNIMLEVERSKPSTSELIPEGIYQPTLQEHLQQQLPQLDLDDEQQQIALVIIDELNDDGYLKTPLKQIREDIGNIATTKQIEKILLEIQTLEPTGIAARNLQESLLLQLIELPNNKTNQLAFHIINQSFDELTANNDKTLMRAHKITNKELQDAKTIIQSLNPRPGAKFANTDTQAIIPDLLINVKGNHYEILLNDRLIPKLSINQHYATLINKLEDKTLAKKHLADARQLIQALNQRNSTLLKVTNVIFQRQTDFISDANLKPLSQSEIAEAVKMHTSTISRATSNKYIQTPHGTFALKYFFDRKINGNGKHSVQQLIVKTINEEDKSKPLSDNKIMRLLNQHGINIARRTVMKYREQLKIPPSTERRLF